MSTLTLVNELKASDQDFEFYPTTRAMLDAVCDKIHHTMKSILDIGAADGRALTYIKERLDRNVKLMSVEKSKILMSKQPPEIIPVGTDFNQMDIMAASADVIFCNPPYSQYESWMERILDGFHAKQLFMVVPRDWSERPTVKATIKSRNLTSEVIYTGDFLKADRPARAKIEVVMFTNKHIGWRDEPLDNDPFHIWFDQNVWSKYETSVKEETIPDPGKDVTKKHSVHSVESLVASYTEEYQRIQSNYFKVFELDYAILKELGINKDSLRDGIKNKLNGLRMKYWKIVFERLSAINKRLTTKSSKILMDKLHERDTVEFNADTVYAVLLWVLKNANVYIDDQLIDLFERLTDNDHVFNYKSNTRTWKKGGWRYMNQDMTHYALDYRIVYHAWQAISPSSGRDYDFPNGLHRTAHELIRDVVACLFNLGFILDYKTVDGETVDYQNSLNRKWVAGKWENFVDANGETVFQVKGYLNGNLHFRFRPNVIKAMNIEVGRLKKWINSVDDVVNEMGYTEEDAKMYFNSNQLIGANTLLLN